MSLIKSAKKGAIAISGRDVEVLKAKLIAKQVECDFWAETSRNLQNHLQTVLRGQAAILEQMATSTVRECDVHEAIARMGQELRQPLTTVDATVALVSSMRDGTQGRYTFVNQSNTQKVTTS